MTDHQLAILKIAEYLVRVVGEHIAAGQLFQLVYAQTMHLARIAVDGF